MELLYRQSPPDLSNTAAIILRESARENFTPPRKRGRNKFSNSPEVTEPTDSLDSENNQSNS